MTVPFFLYAVMGSNLDSRPVPQTLNIHYLLLSIDDITQRKLSCMLSIAIVINLYSYQSTLYI